MRKFSFLTIPRQGANLMQCSTEHVYNLVKTGKLCYIKDGWNIRFKPENLDDYAKYSNTRRTKDK
jgi:excisionase family DNA binding protein